MTSKVFLDRQRSLGEIDPKLFGGFLEHMGRAIYQGIYDPASPLSDSRGLRKDVLAALGDFGATPLLDVSASYQAESGRSALSIVNRSQQANEAVEVTWQGWDPGKAARLYQLNGSDPKAHNTFAAPDKVKAYDLGPAAIQDGKLSLKLPPLSFITLVVE